MESNYYQEYFSDLDWLMFEGHYDPALLSVQESLFTLSNGYIGSRGIYEESPKGTLTGTFFAGVFEESISHVAEIINAPNPFYLTVDVSKIERLDIATMPFESHKRVLDLKKALLIRDTVYKSPANHLYSYQSLRFISHDNVNIAAMQVIIKPLSKDTHFTINAKIDTSAKNHGIIIEHDTQDFNIHHVEQIEDIFYLSVTSLDHEKEIAYGQQLIIEHGNKIEIIKNTTTDIHLEENETLIITKLISFFVAKNPEERKKLMKNTVSALKQATQQGFSLLLKQHINAMEKRWQKFEFEIVGDGSVMQALRFNVYHLLCSAHEKVTDVSIGAKLLTGEGYKGHIFWETELLLLPCFLLASPTIAYSLLMYRYTRLTQAKELALTRGFKGALFPWESADKGKDETPSWTRDLDNTIKIVHTGKQSLHINVAIFYAIDLYYSATHDHDFMLKQGLEMSIEIARFWKSKVVYSRRKNNYKIKKVMGPDEFHETINNNAYTNKMVAWSIQKTLAYLTDFENNFPTQCKLLRKKLKFYNKERQKLAQIAEKLVIPMQDKIILQFDNYSKLKNMRLPTLNLFGLPNLPPDLLVADYYKTQYIKQADVVLLLLLIPEFFDKKVAEANFHFYDNRTLHESSWSPPIYATLAAQLNFIEQAYRYFSISLEIDRKDIYHNTRMGMHAPSIAGCWLAFIYGFCGIRIQTNCLSITPALPELWQSVSVKICYLHYIVSIKIRKQIVDIRCTPLHDEPMNINQELINIKIGHQQAIIEPYHDYSFELDPINSAAMFGSQVENL